MKIEYDQEVDALYIRIQEKLVSRTKELEDGINLDIDEDGKIIGLEIIGATERYNQKDIFNIATENLILEEATQPI
ncbi:MAG: DUF2283 domain-containing protein [Desulfobacterales bacterium]|nr:DUF2283 domain-containing protein [Desulfobacterales bacterium]